MKLANSELRYVVSALVAAPILVFAAYVTYLVVPDVVRVVVPAVVRAITGA